VDFHFLDGYDILKNDGLIISLSVGLSLSYNEITMFDSDAFRFIQVYRQPRCVIGDQALLMLPSSHCYSQS
jgi:hypothetical protein